MKKSILKYMLYSLIILLPIVILTNGKINEKVFNKIINEKKDNLSSKLEITKIRLENDELINFKNLYTLKNLYYIENNRIRFSANPTEINKKIKLQEIPQKEELVFLKKGYWFWNEEILTYYTPVENKGVLILETEIKQEKNIVKKIRLDMLKIILFLILYLIVMIFGFYIYNLYYPLYKLKKYIKKIENPIRIENYNNKIISENRGEFSELIEGMNAFFDSLRKKLKIIEGDKKARSRVYEIMKLKNSQVMSLYEFAKTLSFDIELEKIYIRIKEIFFNAMGSKVLVIALKDDEGNSNIDFIEGLSNYENIAQNSVEKLVGKLGKPIKIRDSEEDKKVEFIKMTNSDLKKMKKFMAIPLKLGEENIGYMIVDEVFNGKLNHNEEIKTLATIGEIVARAIQKALKYREMNIGLNMTSLLYRITTLVEQNRNLDEIFREIVKSIKKVVDYSSAAIYLLNDNNELENVPKYREGEKDEILQTVEFKLGNGIKAHVANKKETVIIKDVRESAKGLKALFNEREEQIASFISVPMLIKDKLIGVLNLTHSEPNKFKDEDKKVLKLFANQAAATIEKVKKDNKIEELLIKVKNDSITDPLTQLYNRRYMMEILDRELERANREGTSVGLLASDIDFFKKFNDTYGHQVGDIVLQEVAKELKSAIRGMDIPCRFGGEEFFIILPNINMEVMYRIGERIRQSLKNRIIMSGNNKLQVTISIGIALSNSANTMTTDKLIKNADTALYKAKETGRDKVVLYDGI